jgi:hypothetical protein
LNKKTKTNGCRTGHPYIPWGVASKKKRTNINMVFHNAHFNEQQERKRVVHQELRMRTLGWYKTTFDEGGAGGCWARHRIFEVRYLRPGMSYGDMCIALNELWFDGEAVDVDPAEWGAQDERLRIMKYVQGYEDEDESDEDEDESDEEEDGGYPTIYAKVEMPDGTTHQIDITHLVPEEVIQAQREKILRDRGFK